MKIYYCSNVIGVFWVYCGLESKESKHKKKETVGEWDASGKMDRSDVLVIVCQEFSVVYWHGDMQTYDMCV